MSSQTQHHDSHSSTPIMLIGLCIVLFLMYEAWTWLQAHGGEIWASIHGWVIGIVIALVLFGITWAVWRIRMVYLAHKREDDMLRLENEILEEEEYAKQIHNSVAEQTLLILQEARINQDNVDIAYSDDGSIAALKIIRAREQANHVIVQELQQQIEELKQLASGQLQIEAPEKDLIPQAPAFMEMSHLIRPDRLPLCWTAEGPAYGTILDLLSMAVSGKPGRGKTTALMYYVAMLLRAGAEVWVWDPHGAMGELSQLNGKPLQGMPATSKVVYLDRKQDIVASVPKLHKELDARDEYYRPAHQVKHPLLLLADELPVIAEFDDEVEQEYKVINKQSKTSVPVPSMVDIIKKFVLQARKWNCYFIGSGQSFDADVLPTAVIENLNSRIVFFSSDRRARMSGLESDAIKTLLPTIRRAGPGVMIFDCSRWDEPMIGSIPAIDMPSMLAYLGVSSSTSSTATMTTSFRPSLRIVEADVEAGDEAAPKRDGVDDEQEELSELEMKVLNLLSQGTVSQRKIIEEIYGVSGGDKYTKASAEMTQIIAKLLKRKHA